jgi:hypothetical protein
MIKPFQVITQGRLSNVTKKALLIAVLGYLSFLDPVIPGVDGGGGGKDTELIAREERVRRIQMDDEEILIILKAFTQII